MQKTSFQVQVGGGSALSSRLASSFVLPGRQVPIIIQSSEKSRNAAYRLEGGDFTRGAPNRWEWRTPNKVGLYPIRITRRDTGEVMVINAFVMVPYESVTGEYLNHYRLGRYPTGGSRYQHPIGFIEVTPENEETALSPHFRLRQFLCKQASTYPKYVVVREELVSKLEHTLALLNAQGYPVKGLHIMSGFRTPFYNHTLGNVKFSRHMLGEAADVLMDGIIGKQGPMGAGTLFRLMNDEECHGQSLIGGLGKYGGIPCTAHSYMSTCGDSLPAGRDRSYPFRLFLRTAWEARGLHFLGLKEDGYEINRKRTGNVLLKKTSTTLAEFYRT